LNEVEEAKLDSLLTIVGTILIISTYESILIKMFIKNIKKENINEIECKVFNFGKEKEVKESVKIIAHKIMS